MSKNDSMNHRVTLNIRYDQPQDAWDAVMKVYESMPGWLGAVDLPRWYGTEDEARHVWASVEPGGIVFEARMERELWEPWIEELCMRLSAALGRSVHDAEL
jgi:hypothetical protein